MFFMRYTGCFKEFEEGETAYACVVGSIEQFDGDYADRMFINQTGAVSILSTGRFSMVMFTRSRRESFLLASRISMPTICLFSSRSTVIPSSMSMLSPTSASLNWMYKASASLSYSIFNLNHLHRFFFFTAVIIKTFPASSLKGTRRYFSETLFHAFSFPSEDGSIKSELSIDDSISASVILCIRILFFACLVYFIIFAANMLSQNISAYNHLSGDKKNEN